MTPDDVLRYIAKQPRVTLREAAMPGDLKIAKGDAAGLAELERNLSILKDAGDICRWVIPGKPATKRRKATRPKPVVTLSSVAAYRFRLKISASSTKWLDVGTQERMDRTDRVPVRTTPDGAKVMCESDMTEEPPGALDNIVDERAAIEDDPDFGRSLAIAEEKMLGLLRPTLALVGVRPWTAGNWERAPGAHVCDPLDDPRRVPVPGAVPPRRRMTEAKLRAIRPAPEDCPVCRGREMRFMIALVSRKAGKNRAARPPELVDGVEYCCKCGSHPQDGIWPRVFKINEPESNGKPTP